MSAVRAYLESNYSVRRENEFFLWTPFTAGVLLIFPSGDSVVEILFPFPPGGSVVKILLPAAVLNKAQKARTCAVFVQGNRLRERNFSSERPADEYFMFILVPKPFVPGAFPIAAVCPKCRNCRDDICHFACCRLSEAQKTFVWLSFPFVSACRSERHFACYRFK